MIIVRQSITVIPCNLVLGSIFFSLQILRVQILRVFTSLKNIISVEQFEIAKWPPKWWIFLENVITQHFRLCNLFVIVFSTHMCGENDGLLHITDLERNNSV